MRDAFARRRRRARRRRHRGLERRRGVERADRGDDAGRVGAQPRDPRHRLLPRRARGVPDPARAGPRRLDRVRRLEERAGGRQERRRVLVGQGGRAAPRALPGRGGRRGRASASTPSTPTPSSRARGSGTRAGARSAPRRTASSPTSSRSTTASARRSASTSCPRTSPRRCCTSRPRGGRARAPATCSTSTAGCRRRTRAERVVDQLARLSVDVRQSNIGAVRSGADGTSSAGSPTGLSPHCLFSDLGCSRDIATRPTT